MSISNRFIRPVFKHAHVIVVVASVTACATGGQFASVEPGMAKAEVIDLLGEPDGYAQDGTSEVLTYTNRRMGEFTSDRADYGVVLKDGVVASYGVGEVRPFRPNVGTMFVYPMP